MQKIIFFLTLLLTVCQLNAQVKSMNKKPDEQIKVNKQYDENGNLIAYDSSCVRSWSTDTIFKMSDLDSMREAMEFLFGNSFGSLFSDSIISNGDLFSNFRKQFFEENNQFFYHGNMDSLFQFPPQFYNSSPDFDQLRDETMSHFDHFFYADSSHFQMRDFHDSVGIELFDNENIERFREEFRKQVELLQNGFY